MNEPEEKEVKGKESGAEPSTEGEEGYSSEPKQKNQKLKDLGYKFVKVGYGKNVNTELRHIKTGERFEFDVFGGDRQRNQKRYEELGEAVTEYVYDYLEEKLDLDRIPVQINSGISNYYSYWSKIAQKNEKGFFFVSKNAQEAYKLMILIHSSGAVRAGQWARSLIINESFESGTMVPYIERATQEGYGIIITNGNQGSQSPQDHFVSVWNKFIKKAKAKDIVIVAHDFGGVVVHHGLKNIKEAVKRITAVAFTNSVHSVNIKESREIKAFFKNRTRNWVSSMQPLDKIVRSDYGGDCLKVSAGTTEQDWTSHCAKDSVFEFFKERRCDLAFAERYSDDQVRLDEIGEEGISDERYSDKQVRLAEMGEESISDEEQQEHQDTEGRLRNSEQRSDQLESSLAEERQAHQETERRLRNSEQRSDQLESSLAEERQAHQETERRLRNSEQRSDQLESSLAEERQAHQETEGRLRNSEQRSDQLESSLAEERQAHQETERRLRNSEQRSDQLESSLAEERQAHQETERRLRNSEQRSDQLESSLAEERQAHQETERRLHSGEQRSNELETTLTTLQRVFEEHRRSTELTHDWVLDRNDIRLSDNEIGRGAWGRVLEGTFRGCKVAVKQIHDLILSDVNRRLFEREMDIASRCRHPCLLQFIGATNDDQSPLFVTELLDTSLREVLRQRALERTEISTIALDVVKGLNYLHLYHPAPIIHRDISSANVLLWQYGQSWRAKVSDYGTAKFMEYSMTANPGAVIYSAPEAQTSRQSPKIDVYSFGVLLCEMNIREAPEVERRDEQVAMVTNHFYRDIIRRCLLRDSEQRPSMEEIINQLENQQ